MTSFDPIRALSRGLEVLRIVNEREEPSLADVTVAADLPKATVVRILETLQYCGYISKDAQKGYYFATGRTLGLSRGYNIQRSYRDMAQPHLEALRREIGWPLNLGCFDQDAMVILYTNRELLSLSTHVTTGSRSPIAVTALGRVFLAFSSESTRNHVLELLRASETPWNQAAHNKEEMTAILQDVKAQGFAFSDPAYLKAIYDSNVWAVAVPIMKGTIVELCLSAMVLSNVMEPEEGVKRILPPLRRTAGLISQGLTKESS